VLAREVFTVGHARQYFGAVGTAVAFLCKQRFGKSKFIPCVGAGLLVRLEQQGTGQA